MKLKTESGRALRASAATAIAVCALTWSAGFANATLYQLSPNGLVVTGGSNPPANFEISSFNGGSVASEDVGIYANSDPNHTQLSTPMVTSIVEKGDTANPYYNAVTDPNVYTFIYQVTNASTVNFALLTLDGFGGYGVAFGEVIGSGWSQPVDVQMNNSAGTINFNPGIKEANGSSPPAVSDEIVLYTNATNYAAVADPVSWPSSTYHVSSYEPALAPTPEPSSLVLAVVGIDLSWPSWLAPTSGISSTCSTASLWPRQPLAPSPRKNAGPKGYLAFVCAALLGTCANRSFRPPIKKRRPGHSPPIRYPFAGTPTNWASIRDIRVSLHVGGSSLFAGYRKPDVGPEVPLCSRRFS